MIGKTLLNKVKSAIAANSMFSRGDRVVVAVSGGPDSVAMLHCLWTLRDDLGVSLHVAHVDHGLRSADSAADASYVKELARSLGLDLTTSKLDTRALQHAHKLTLEEAARLGRYSFLAGVVDATKSAGVAVGHTADDQVETVLLHLVRGAGATGLRGMRVVSELPLATPQEQPRSIVRVLRPLLDASRAEVNEYCRAQALQPRFDSTNNDLAFCRNRVRHEIIPVVRRLNPHFEQSVLRSSRIAAVEDDYLSAVARDVMLRVATLSQNQVTFDKAAWRDLPKALQYRLLREAAAKLQGDLLDLSAIHLDNAVETIDSKPAGSAIVWPNGIQVIQRYGDFVVRRSAQRQSALTDAGEEVAMPGRAHVAGRMWWLEGRMVDERCDARDDPLHADLDPIVGSQVLAVRRRRAGDRFQPAGMAQEKKLQDFMVDAKVPRDERDDIPLLTSGGRIAWVVGLRVAEWARSRGERALCLTFAHNE